MPLIETLFLALAIVFVLLLSLTTAGHALLTKRHARSAVGWILVCLLMPGVGPLLYGILGVNRIRTRARAGALSWRVSQEAPRAPALGGDYAEFDRVARSVTHMPAVGGNRLELLHNGEQAYPAMLAAIDGASRRLYLATYIFDSDETGRRFVDALSRAYSRGVDVRVLVDGVGELYSRPRISKLLAREGIPTVRFIPPAIFPPTLHVNLRNHCKMLLADGRVGFTGGMNLGDRHLVDSEKGGTVFDVHCEIEGPLIDQMERVFLDMWCFACSGDPKLPDLPSPPQPVERGAYCRSLVDGPNEALHSWLMVLLGVLSAANGSIRIMTPYFLPPRELIATLQSAALRGVEVEVVLPETNNLPYVHWASRRQLDELVETGVHVYYQPGPFVHSKLLTVDDRYALIGSANWDPRSLRLNFEFGVEVYDEPFARRLGEHFARTVAASRRVTLEELHERSLPIRVRDAVSWLFSPYL